jgi:hypothetical protein
VSRADPSSARALAPVEGLSYGAAWLRAEGPLLVAADWFGFRSLNLLDVASGEAHVIGARGARFPDVGPHGEIVYENAVYTANLWLLDPRPGGHQTPLWHSTRYSIEPELTRDGSRVVFASNRDGADALYAGPLDGQPRRISFGENLRYSRPHWSIDGRSVYAVRTVAAAGNLAYSEAVRIAAEGGTVETLPLGRSVKDVREGGDGMLYWGETAGHAMRLLRAPLGDLARPERLPVPLVSHYQLSGGRLAFVQPQLEALTLCRLDTLACAPSKMTIAESGHDHWILTPRSVYARTPVGDALRLGRFDVETGKLTRTWDAAPDAAGSSLAVSDDERSIIVVKEEGPAIDLMIAR